MNALQIAQIANMGLSTLLNFLPKKGETAPTKATKADIKSYLQISTDAAEQLGHLVVTNRKAFNKDLDKMVDTVDSMLKNAEWK